MREGDIYRYGRGYLYMIVKIGLQWMMVHMDRAHFGTADAIYGMENSQGSYDLVSNWLSRNTSYVGNLQDLNITIGDQHANNI